MALVQVIDASKSVVVSLGKACEGAHRTRENFVMLPNVIENKSDAGMQPRTKYPQILSLPGGADCLGFRGQFQGSLEIVCLQGLLSVMAKAIGISDHEHQGSKIGAAARAGARFSEACLADGALGRFVAFDQ